MKRLALISLLAITITACSDRERVNCPEIRNKALGAATVLGQVENNLGAKCK
jgi:hypothetical protein